ncbi:MAG: DUF6178 family protein [Desulfobacteraceae bacterium]
MTDYRLLNIRKKDRNLAIERQEVLNTNTDRAVDRILEYKWPAALIQSFPGQDLYFLMNSVGHDDFIPVLSLASSDQWEHLLDMEVWEDDTILLPRMTRMLDLLFQADPERLVRWIVTEKPGFIEYYFSRNMEIRIREHDESASDFSDDFMTFDDKFYFRFPHASDEPESELEKEMASSKDTIVGMLNKIADMDLSVYHGLMQETSAVIPVETEEEEFRLKTTRLAEHGFLPPHEAVGIYQAASRFKPRKRPGKKIHKHDPDTDLPPQYPISLMEDQNLFTRALSQIEPDIFVELQAEFASLVNKIISADRIRVQLKEDLEQAISKASSCISVGLETIDAKDPAGALQLYFLEDIFRKGSFETFRLKRKVEAWYRDSFISINNLPLSFFAEKWLGVAGGLMLKRPLYYDNYETGALYRNFESLKEIRETDREVEKLMETDRIIKAIDPDISGFSDVMLTYKTLLLTLWARDRMKLESSVKAIVLNSFKPFYASLFSNDGSGKIERLKRDDFVDWLAGMMNTEPGTVSSKTSEMADELFDELESEYGAVKVEDLDPKFAPHFLLKEE